MNKRFKEVTYYEISYSDLEEFVKEVLNLDSFRIENENFSNGSSDSWDVDSTITSFWKEYEEEEFEKIVEEKECIDYRINTLLTGLCIHGYIPKGSYKVDFYW